MTQRKLALLLGLIATLAPRVTHASTPPIPSGEPPEATSATTPTPPARTGLYLHFGGGSGFALMSSDGVTSLFGEDFKIGLGFDFSYSFTGGYRNIVQLELRRGDSSHAIRQNAIFGQSPTVEIPMDYDFAEYVAKLNMLAVSRGNVRSGDTALFVVAGTADIKWLDKVDDGFRGDAKVYGLEYTRFAPSRKATVSLGLRRYDIEFDRITLLGRTVPYNVSASNWVFNTALTVGFAL